MEHTPKNLQIPAVKRTEAKRMKREVGIVTTMDFLHIDPTLQKLLNSKTETEKE